MTRRQWMGMCGALAVMTTHSGHKAHVSKLKGAATNVVHTRIGRTSGQTLVTL